MSLSINIQQITDVAVLQCAGRIVRAQALCLLKEDVTSLSQLRVIMLDLSEVKMVDAGGLGMLVFLHKWACQRGIQLKLVNPSKLVTEILTLTGLTAVLRISSVEDVLQIFCNVDGATQNADSAVA
jgi:anti-anti-sigma factor